MNVNRTDWADLLEKQHQAAAISNIVCFPKHETPCFLLSIHVPLFLKARCFSNSSALCIIPWYILLLGENHQTINSYYTEKDYRPFLIPSTDGVLHPVCSCHVWWALLFGISKQLSVSQVTCVKVFSRGKKMHEKHLEKRIKGPCCIHFISKLF